jgi:hypothetical protein
MYDPCYLYKTYFVKINYQNGRYRHHLGVLDPTTELYPLLVLQYYRYAQGCRWST